MSDDMSCDPKSIKMVRESYIRCQGNEEFFKVFYQNLLGKSDEIKDKFKDTDWIRQHNLIKLAIKSAILYAENPDMPIAEKNISDVGDTHSKLKWDIQPDLYPLWLDSIVETVQKIDGESSPELLDAWRKVLTPAIQLITSKY